MHLCNNQLLDHLDCNAVYRGYVSQENKVKRRKRLFNAIRKLWNERRRYRMPKDESISPTPISYSFRSLRRGHTSGHASEHTSSSRSSHDESDSMSSSSESDSDSASSESNPKSYSDSSTSSARSSSTSGSISLYDDYYPAYSSNAPNTAISNYVSSGLSYYGNSSIIMNAVEYNQFFPLTITTLVVKNNKNVVSNLPKNVSFYFHSDNTVLLNEYYKSLSKLKNNFRGIIYKTTPYGSCNDTESLQVDTKESVWFRDVSNMGSSGLIAFAPFDYCAPMHVLQAVQDRAKAILFYNASTASNSLTNFDHFEDAVDMITFETLPMALISYENGIAFEKILNEYSASSLNSVQDGGALVEYFGNIDATARLGVIISKEPKLLGLYIFIGVLLGLIGVIGLFICLHFSGAMNGFYRLLNRHGIPVQERIVNIGPNKTENRVTKEMLDTLPVRMFSGPHVANPNDELVYEKDWKLDKSESFDGQGNVVTTAERGSKYFDQRECTICLCEYSEESPLYRELPCHHIFHPACIDPYLLKNSDLCPLCKQSVTNMLENASEDNV